MAPKVSICLPVYNGERHLGSAIESVLSQTYSDFELIVSDDRSTDASPDIVESYLKQDKRISFSRNERNLGLFANYNRCLALAEGELVKPFAQDDLFYPEMLARTVDAIVARDSVVLVSTRRLFLDDAGKDVSAQSAEPSAGEKFGCQRVVSGAEAVVKSLIPVVNYIGEPCAVLFRAKAAGTGFDPRYHHLGDLEYWLRILRSGGYYYIDEPLCGFRKHGDSRTALNRKSLLFAPDHLALGAEFADLLAAAGYSETDYLNCCLDALSRHVENLTRLGLVTLEDVRSRALLAEASRPGLAQDVLSPAAAELLLLDLMSFREIAYHCFNLIGRHTEQVALIRRYEKMIARRERRLADLVGSASWTATRLFREIKRFIFDPLPSEEEVPYPATRRFDETIETVEEQRRYLRYLRMRLVRIQRSASWKFSAPLRIFGLPKYL